MPAEKTTPVQNEPVNPVVTDEQEPVRMDVIEEIAGMSAGTERPALIWGNTDRATVAAEALWVFARRTGLDGRGDEALTVVQDFIANLMHLCGQEGITDDETTFTELVSMAEMHYLAELEGE